MDRGKPKIAEELSDNISRHFDQKYVCVLVGNQNKENVDFYISNNDAACSSIYDFSKKVKDKILWKERNFLMTEKIQLKMQTLDDIFNSNKINLVITHIGLWIFKGLNYWHLRVQKIQ